MLFVCPYSCGRHNSIGAIKHGYKDRISYLFIKKLRRYLYFMFQVL